MSAQGPAPRARIRRDTHNGMIGGVAAGFARHLDVDVVWIRLAFVLLTVFGGGFGLVAYLAAWLIVPADDGTAIPLPPRERRDGRGARFWTGVVLVAVGGLILIDTVLSPLSARIAWVSTSGIVLPLVLIGIGVLIYRASREDDVDLALSLGRLDEERFERFGERVGERVEREAEAFGERVERWGEEVEHVAEDWEQRIERRAKALKELRSRSRVAPVTFGLAFVTFGGLWLASSLGAPGVTITRALAATLLVIGVGLVVGAVLGRGRGLILAGALIAPLVVVSALIPQLPDGLEWISIGPDGVIVSDAEEWTEAPTTLAALPAEATYEFGAGSFTLDLRELGDEIAAAGTVTIAIEMGIGSLRVLVPDDVTVTTDVELGIGRIRVLRETTSGGVGVSDRQTVVLGDGSGGRLVLEIAQGIGDVLVTR